MEWEFSQIEYIQIFEHIIQIFLAWPGIFRLACSSWSFKVVFSFPTGVYHLIANTLDFHLYVEQLKSIFASSVITGVIPNTLFPDSCRPDHFCGSSIFPNLRLQSFPQYPGSSERKSELIILRKELPP